LQFTSWAIVLLLLSYKLTGNAMYVSFNQEFVISQMLRHSISTLPGKGLKDVFPLHMSPRATQPCVAGNILPASYRLSRTMFSRHLRASADLLPEKAPLVSME